MIALDNDASCVEALYNLGLCNKKLGIYEEALEGFFKLQSIVRNHNEVVYHIANIYELMGDNDQATEWYLQLLGLVPTDPGILQKVGSIFDAEGDKQQAYQYHFDSYKNFPSNLEVIDWLGSYFIEMQVHSCLAWIWNIWFLWQLLQLTCAAPTHAQKYLGKNTFFIYLFPQLRQVAKSVPRVHPLWKAEKNLNW